MWSTSRRNMTHPTLSISKAILWNRILRMKGSTVTLAENKRPSSFKKKMGSILITALRTRISSWWSIKRYRRPDWAWPQAKESRCWAREGIAWRMSISRALKPSCLRLRPGIEREFQHQVGVEIGPAEEVDRENYSRPQPRKGFRTAKNQRSERS